MRSFISEDNIEQAICPVYYFLNMDGSEILNKKYKWYNGNTVVILGENYYSDQVVNVKNPQRVGTYSYTNKGSMPMTVPVIDGDINE